MKRIIGKSRVLAFGAAALAFAGCQSSGSVSRDPILGRDRIPPQGLPTRGGYGAAPKDPLLKGATSTGRNDVSMDPERPGPATTPASLAGARPTAETDTLAFDRDRPRADIVPVSANTAATGDAAEAIQRRGGRVYAPTKLSNGNYEFRAAVPLGTSGTMRTYTVVARDQSAAMRDLLKQIKEDDKK